MKGSDYTRSGKAALLGALIGSALGIGVGLLLAPEEGQRLRRRLVYRLERAADRIGTYVERLNAPAGESEARRTGKALVADVQEQADQIMHDVDALIDAMKRHETKRSASP